jgi:hypothetical protein
MVLRLLYHYIRCTRLKTGDYIVDMDGVEHKVIKSGKPRAIPVYYYINGSYLKSFKRKPI